MNGPEAHLSIREFLRMTPQQRAAAWIRYNERRGIKPAFREGARVMTDYEIKERYTRRIVIRIYPAPHSSQTGWLVDTECGLCGLDSAWFREAPPELQFFT